MKDDARAMLDAIVAYQESGKSTLSSDKNVRLATIEPYFTVGKPRVLFDGESRMGERTYSWDDSYTPKAGDRVYMMPVGSTYLIMGAISDIRSRPVLIDARWDDYTQKGAPSQATITTPDSITLGPNSSAFINVCSRYTHTMNSTDISVTAKVTPQANRVTSIDIRPEGFDLGDSLEEGDILMYMQIHNESGKPDKLSVGTPLKYETQITDWNPTHTWLRMYEARGMMYFQTSPNGNDWNTVVAEAQTAITSKPAQIHFNTYGVIFPNGGGGGGNLPPGRVVSYTNIKILANYWEK